MSDPVVIVGTGALACLFAARLASTGIGITMLGSWPDGLRALHEHGVRLMDPGGIDRSFRIRATDDPQHCVGARNAIVLVKAWQTSRAANQLAAFLSQDGLALTLQNGLGNRETLVNRLGEQRVIQGSTTTGATLVEPGVVRPGGEGIVSLGEHPAVKSLGEMFELAGFNIQYVSDIDALIWGKLVINAAINPLTALLRVPNGELLRIPSARQLMGELAEEVALVAAAKNIQLTVKDPVQAAEEVAQRTATNHSSMYQDMKRGAPTEIDAICGAVASQGEKVNVKTPVNRTMWHLVKAAAARDSDKIA